MEVGTYRYIVSQSSKFCQFRKAPSHLCNMALLHQDIINFSTTPRAQHFTPRLLTTFLSAIIEAFLSDPMHDAFPFYLAGSLSFSMFAFTQLGHLSALPPRYGCSCLCMIRRPPPYHIHKDKNTLLTRKVEAPRSIYSQTSISIPPKTDDIDFIPPADFELVNHSNTNYDCVLSVHSGN